MPDRKPIGDLEMRHRGPTCPIGEQYACEDPLETPMGCRSGKSVSDGACRFQMGLL